MATANPSTFASIRNQGTISLDKIPVLNYGRFYGEVVSIMKQPHMHCVNYYAFSDGDKLKFICCLADDIEGDIKIYSHEAERKEKMQFTSITREVYAFHIFEREITENFNVEFIYSPWNKPVRYAFDRADKSKIINNYPFYKIQSDELHEVGVGPIHAGVIEPGHFRFLCNGETVLHLEIQLGWQHRGVESLFLNKPTLIQRTVLSESIAGDTALGHSLAFVSLMESLSGVVVSERLEIERTIALELERIAMHVGDLGNINIGMAYQLASSVFGTLRTPVINYAQTWCGNRFGKGLNRVGGSHYPLTQELREKLSDLLNRFESSFVPMADRTFSLSTFLMRAENIGKVTHQQMSLIGAVGMTARAAGMSRDLRSTHPFAAYQKYKIPTQTLTQGDVWARAMLRSMEVKDSIGFLRQLIDGVSKMKDPEKPKLEKDIRLAPNTFAISMTEGWRGEICHCAVTNSDGGIMHYKVKDPSVHNWMALALSLRDLEISDFPINNKSYNLSYCGHDL
jgi:Ni,Fe-hydrogenase III large subunit